MHQNEELVRRAAECQRVKAYDESIEILQSVLSDEPHNTKALFYIALAYQESGRLNEAVRYYRSCLDVPGFLVSGEDDAAMAALVNLARVYERLNQFSQAVECSRKAIRLDPCFYLTYCNLSMLFCRLHRHQEAITVLKEGLDVVVEGDKAHLHYNLGCVYSELGDHEPALIQGRRCLELASDKTDAYLLLGNVCFGLKRFEESIDYWQKVLEIRPHDHGVNLNLGSAYLQLEKLPEAIAFLQKAVDLRPDDGYSHFNLGAACFEAGRHEQGLRHSHKAVELDPACVQAYTNIGLFYQGQGKTEEARRYLEMGNVLGNAD